MAPTASDTGDNQHGQHAPIEAIEAIACCVFLHDRGPLQFAGSWTTEERGYQLKGGRRRRPTPGRARRQFSSTSALVEADNKNRAEFFANMFAEHRVDIEDRMNAGIQNYNRFSETDWMTLFNNLLSRVKYGLLGASTSSSKTSATSCSPASCATAK